MKYNMKILSLINRVKIVYQSLILVLLFLSCGSSTARVERLSDYRSINSIGYDLNNPDETFILPSVLHEISGIAVIDSSSVACVQDENGIVFVYNVRGKGIINYVTFHGNGDYEGITNANGIFYVLRSDGTLFIVDNLESDEPAVEIRLMELPKNDYEGLCYDHKNNRLLIAPKEKIENKYKTGIRHGIFGFDLDKEVLLNDPVIAFDMSEIRKNAAKNDLFMEPEKSNKNKGKMPEIKFNPSAIGINPVSGKLFLLSSSDLILFVFEPDGTIDNIFRLDPEIFKMPEGITFFENGDMLISNEGRGGVPTILRFSQNNQLK